MSGPVRAGSGAGPGAEAACPTEPTPPPAAATRILASIGAHSTAKSANRRQGQPWGEPVRSKSSTNDAKGVREVEPGAVQDSLVSGGEPLSSQSPTLSPATGRSTADVATTTTSPTTKDSSTDTRGTEVSTQVHRARSRTQRPLSTRHVATMSLAAGASRKDRSSSRTVATYTSRRSGVASDGGIHALSQKPESALASTLSQNNSRQPATRLSARNRPQKSSTHRSRSQISKTGGELRMDQPETANSVFSDNLSVATAAAEAALDAAVCAAMEASDAAAAAAAAAEAEVEEEDAAAAAMDSTADARQQEDVGRSHTASSQTFKPMKDGNTPNDPVTSKTRSLATMLGISHEHLSSHGHEGHRSHHHRSRSHRNSARRRRRHDSLLAGTGNGWEAAQLQSRLGGGNTPCMVFVWPRPSAHAMATAAAAAQAAADAAGVVLRSKQSPSDGSTLGLTPARWLWQGLHLLAMLHLWPIEEGLQLALMFKLPHLRRRPSAARHPDGVAVLQEPQRRHSPAAAAAEYAEESEGTDRPDSPVLVAAAPCFPFPAPSPGYRSARLRARRAHPDSH